MARTKVVEAIEDPDDEHPVPTAWRPCFVAVVEAFVDGDFQPRHPWVAPITDDLAGRMRAYVDDYGEALVELTEDTWETSVSTWLGERMWEVLVDLRTAAEGRSDMVLRAVVNDGGDGHRIQLTSVYVP